MAFNNTICGNVNNTIYLQPTFNNVTGVKYTGEVSIARLINIALLNLRSLSLQDVTLSVVKIKHVSVFVFRKRNV